MPTCSLKVTPPGKVGSVTEHIQNPATVNLGSRRTRDAATTSWPHRVVLPRRTPDCCYSSIVPGLLFCRWLFFWKSCWPWSDHRVAKLTDLEIEPLHVCFNRAGKSHEISDDRAIPRAKQAREPQTPYH